MYNEMVKPVFPASSSKAHVRKPDLWKPPPADSLKIRQTQDRHRLVFHQYKLSLVQAGTFSSQPVCSSSSTQTASFLTFFYFPPAADQMNTTTHLQHRWTCVDFYHSLLAGLAALILPCVHFYPCLLLSTPVWLNLNTIGELLLLCSSKKTVQGHLFNFFRIFESMWQQQV